ncbi:outer mitochondrial membrane protein porin [Verticillium alfalfae VaMs.102]|uniref:Outer mitochondrial membrane protein porin n=1 Tax=Verticillium alfalfae (strain VaMs.102 / ATCC MYA-4576 / FGSC 10136) TaxID=526221 RepID=C9S6Q9_VERA1|nr:outer mitochondrial membrane protein porin [Verticillium alfalfae VaMs.102]EEY14550.1 outer mitochondrial membrane protein porin [Verticillium alfalfae VaMs.102]
MSVPNFADIAKASNDLLNKDFYHLSAATLEVKSNTPNNVAFKVTGKTSHEKATAGATWNTANALDTKVELADTLAKALKAEGVFSFLPATQAKGAKAPPPTLTPSSATRVSSPGASAGYDVNKAAITGYSAAVGFTAPAYTAAITATDNLSIFAASYYHKVNSQVEAGAKATWNSKTGNNVGLEVASKYRIDPVSFAKVKVNDRGVAALAYNVLLRPGVTLGLGASFDTQKLDQATHKLGASFTFEG